MQLLPMMVAAAVLFAAAPTQAQQFDLTAATCKEFTTSDKDTIALILMWLEGYYRDHNVKPIIDFDSMKTSGTKLVEYCGQHPGDSVFAAADEVMGK